MRGIQNPHLQFAATRYLALIQQERWVPVQKSTNATVQATLQEISGVQFQVTNNTVSLGMHVDESYQLLVSPSSVFIRIQANTWVGGLRALETLSQLVTRGVSNATTTLVIHTANITDAPRYGHRGILLDTARNFYPVESILHLLEALSYNKMNVFHWHATDSQSWPMYMNSLPELSQKGAYSTQEVYQPKDVEKVLGFAEARGIRVILELDMPAHTASIAASHPELLLCADEFWSDYAAEPPAGQLNPIKGDTFRLVETVLKEATSRFPDGLYHAGGDEINTACWELSDEFRAYTMKFNMTSKEVWFQWTKHVLDYIKRDLKKRPILWEDSIKDGAQGYSNSTIVQTWLLPPSKYTALGYDVIVSNYDYFYLDCGHGGWVGNDNRYISAAQTETADDVFNYGGIGGSWCAPFKTWQRIYSYDMMLDIANDTHKGSILGGEVAMWSEQTGPTVMDGRIWPRSAAAAEIYWSGSYDEEGERRTVERVSERFYDWVYRLQARGIDAEPVQPKYCAQHPGACNLSHT
ncbi:hypothetical protein INT47_008892 [Mucor saturninus]|uniref:Beta-hexosaminidase n=1 Tax=Mucor saturninus TaxID=64648 RepID=A0A8H7R131_9FUNG|nr:hypothetical protein INT47_008892 [Mucor saturninus]